MTDEGFKDIIKRELGNIQPPEEVRARILKGLTGDSMKEKTNSISMTSAENEHLAMAEETRTQRVRVTHTGRLTAAAAAAVLVIGGAAYGLNSSQKADITPPAAPGETTSQEDVQSISCPVVQIQYDSSGETVYDKFGDNSFIYQIPDGRYLVEQWGNHDDEEDKWWADEKGESAGVYDYFVYDPESGVISEDILTSDLWGADIKDEGFVLYGDYGYDEQTERVTSVRAEYHSYDSMMEGSDFYTYEAPEGESIVIPPSFSQNGMYLCAATTKLDENGGTATLRDAYSGVILSQTYAEGLYECIRIEGAVGADAYQVMGTADNKNVTKLLDRNFPQGIEIPVADTVYYYDGSRMAYCDSDDSVFKVSDIRDDDDNGVMDGEGAREIEALADMETGRYAIIGSRAVDGHLIMAFEELGTDTEVLKVLETNEFTLVNEFRFELRAVPDIYGQGTFLNSKTGELYIHDAAYCNDLQANIFSGEYRNYSRVQEDGEVSTAESAETLNTEPQLPENSILYLYRDSRINGEFTDNEVVKSVYSAACDIKEKYAVTELPEVSFEEHTYDGSFTLAEINDENGKSRLTIFWGMQGVGGNYIIIDDNAYYTDDGEAQALIKELTDLAKREYLSSRPAREPDECNIIFSDDGGDYYSIDDKTFVDSLYAKVKAVTESYEPEKVQAGSSGEQVLISFLNSGSAETGNGVMDIKIPDINGDVIEVDMLDRYHAENGEVGEIMEMIQAYTTEENVVTTVTAAMPDEELSE